MALVDYSDSDDSGDEQPQPQSKSKSAAPTSSKSTAPPPSVPTATNFAIDKSNPRKIRVNLQDRAPSSQYDADGEPAPKRARIGDGGGAFSGFNSILPAPKRDAEKAKAEASRAAAGKTARKVFSLKTGAEPGFSRESDAELRELFAEQDGGEEETSGSDLMNVRVASEPAGLERAEVSAMKMDNAMMFKPLSVARNPQRKKKAVGAISNGTSIPATSQSAAAKPRNSALAPASDPVPAPAPQKISLFSTNRTSEPEASLPPDPIEEEEPYGEEDLLPTEKFYNQPKQTSDSQSQPEAESLASLADSLNLPSSARRQLLGRSNANNSAPISIANFNTDAEYSFNESFRQSNTQTQHNPVRAIASGKHSLKQLVNAATGQKEALEESFATGKRNKKEAGNKYGW